MVCTFSRFDVLTVCCAGFTFAFYWQNYQPTGAAEQWVAFAVWGLFVAAAGAVAFQAALRAGYRRAAAAFE